MRRRSLLPVVALLAVNLARPHRDLALIVLPLGALAVLLALALPAEGAEETGSWELGAGSWELSKNVLRKADISKISDGAIQDWVPLN